jgi:Zn-dependent M32 family carboxypeptidase
MGSNVNVDDLGNLSKKIEEDIIFDINNLCYNNPDYNLYYKTQAYEAHKQARSQAGLTHFDMDFKKVFELLSKHLKNLSGRITEEESDLTNYDSHLQTENFNSQLKNKEESLINLAQEMLTIQSKMISNISRRQTERQTEIKGAYKQHMLAKANNDTFYDYFEEQRNDFTFG